MGQKESKNIEEQAGPWRKFENGGDWNETYQTKLLEDISDLKHQEGVGQARIAVFGIVSSGKSSFINSIASIDKNRITGQTNLGHANESLTRKLAQFVPKRIGSNFVLLDTMGIEGVEGGISMSDASSVMGGKINLGHEFNKDETSSQISKKELSMVSTSHCVVIVMDATMIDTDSLTDAHMSKFETLLKHARDIDVRTILLLTKIDLACPELKKDLTQVYLSQKMEEIVNKASEKIRLPLMNIFPVKNYNKETDLDLNMNILLLLALRQMVRYANDRIEYIADQKQKPTD